LQSASIRIGTRGSRLALVQAEETRRLLGAGEVVPIKTTGDRVTDRPLADAGGKGLFTKEIDEALLSETIDIGVHSAKDLPTWLPEGLIVAACLPRADVRDVFISPKAASLDAMPAGARVGTSSPRRRAMVLRARPDLAVVDLRGNVETRLRKIDEGAADATLLALAGLTRLGLADRATRLLDAETWLPACGQGVIAIVARDGDTAILERLAALDHRESSLALAAERSFLNVLEGSCRTPIGGLATIAGGEMTFRGIVIRPDGSEALEVERSGPAHAAAAIGEDAGADLVRRGGAGFG
jgi:hydroxymethylbilane synthase